LPQAEGERPAGSFVQKIPLLRGRDLGGSLRHGFRPLGFDLFGVGCYDHEMKIRIVEENPFTSGVVDRSYWIRMSPDSEDHGRYRIIALDTMDTGKSVWLSPSRISLSDLMNDWKVGWEVLTNDERALKIAERLVKIGAAKVMD
jgi:hypothetical protein